MSYSQEVINTVSKAPKTLGNQLGRWAVHHDFPVMKIAEITGATRQTVYNWFGGTEVMWAYRPSVESLIKVLSSATSSDDAWRKACKAFNLKG
jgi:hypothetical protein